MSRLDGMPDLTSYSSEGERERKAEWGAESEEMASLAKLAANR